MQGYFILALFASTFHQQYMPQDLTFWEQRYQLNATGWDLGEPSLPLTAYADSLDRNLRILIPGCGNAHEARYLVEKGFTDVTLLDIAPSAVGRIQSVMSEWIESGKLKVICADFFTHTETYDVIFEQTFFCAIDPDKRSAYAAKVHELLSNNGILTGVLFNRDFDGGPPFGGNVQEYVGYFKPFFNSIKIEPCYNSMPPRAGTEVFVKLSNKC